MARKELKTGGIKNVAVVDVDGVLWKNGKLNRQLILFLNENFDEVYINTQRSVPVQYRNVGQLGNLPLYEIVETMKSEYHMDVAVSTSSDHLYHEKTPGVYYEQEMIESERIFKEYYDKILLEGINLNNRESINEEQKNLIDNVNTKRKEGLVKLHEKSIGGKLVNIKKYKEIIETKLVDIKGDGSIWLNQKYFQYATGLRMVNDDKWESLFGFPKRKSETEIEQKHCDLALAIQTLTEDILLKMTKHAKEITGSEHLCLAGGVALNCVANGKIVSKGIFREVFIQPAAGDAGGAPGAGLAAYHIYFEKPRLTHHIKLDAMQGAYLGPEYCKKEIEVTIRKYNAEYTYYDDFGAGRSFGGDRKHLGNDIMAKKGTPLVAVMDGRIENIGWTKLGGWRIGIKDNYNRYWYYGHMKEYESGIEKGDIVSKGDVIGYVGDSGYGSKGTVGKFEPHLHMQIGIVFPGTDKWTFINPHEILKFMANSKKYLEKDKKDKEGE